MSKKRLAIIGALGAMLICAAFAIRLGGSEKAWTSGTKENGRQIEIFFSHEKLGSQTSCARVFPVKRTVNADSDIMEAAIEKLIEGPLEKEVQRGYFTNIDPEIKIRTLEIKNGTVLLDLEGHPSLTGGSCRVSAIRTQLTKTLEQFPEVTGTIISVEGFLGIALQP